MWNTFPLLMLLNFCLQLAVKLWIISYDLYYRNCREFLILHLLPAISSLVSHISETSNPSLA